MSAEVRRVRADEWRALKALRLEMLQDPAAPIAFLDTYDVAVGRPDEFWQGRAARSAAGEESVSYLAVGEDGSPVASVSGLLELPGTDDFEGQPITIRQVHVVGVYVAPASRGAGLFERLLAEVDAWARSCDVERLRLYVHADNARAQAVYRRCGFTPSGSTLEGAIGTELEMTRPLSSH